MSPRKIIFDRTPEQIDAHVRSFCRSINSVSVPIFLRLNPDPDALPRECFNNVLKRCGSQGGTIQYGWAIWTWPGIWLKAEHHAVWRDPDGNLTDVTPNTPDTTHVLFLPDSLRLHDPTRCTRVPNVVRALKPDPDILRIKEAEDLLRDYQDQHTIPGTAIVRANRVVLGQLGMAKDVALFTVLTRYTRGSQPCPCESGLKFRACHLPYVAQLLENWNYAAA